MLPESTATAKDAAQALNVELHQIGKSIVLGNETNTIVAIVCGDQKVNVAILSEELKVDNLTPLKADEIKQRIGFAIGGVSPFALPSGTAIIIDTRLYNLSKCFVAAGHPKAVVSTTGKEIAALTNAKVSLICD
ncbi:MAG TPA: YbaK/EbsC family protein [Pyrinomonadaceae bacterium]|nr:YbaK/EbsC family protein [Pyrinomonadaceae bacterium]